VNVRDSERASGYKGNAKPLKPAAKVVKVCEGSPTDRQRPPQAGRLSGGMPKIAGLPEG